MRVLPSADAIAARDYKRVRKKEGKKEMDGGWVKRALRFTRIVVVRSIMGSRRAPPSTHVAVAVFKSCMLTMGTEGDVGSRELATPAVCGISTSTKSGLLIW